MNVSIKSIAATAVLAAAGLGAAVSASAHEYAPQYTREYAPVQDWQQPPRYAYDGGRYDRDACRVPRWDPGMRYMPGDTVRRHGELYMARGISARVWNVNSPPEWTPNYWVPARCG